MRILLIRHGKAFERDAAAWPDDLRRPLTEEGREEFAKCAKRLKRIEGKVDQVLSSPAVRAWQTAQILAERAGWPEPVRSDILLPVEDPVAAPSAGVSVTTSVSPAKRVAEWAQLLAAVGEDATVAWVGHEPTMGSMASWLLTGEPGRANIRCKKGSVIAIDRERGFSSLAWMITPGLLRSIER